MKYEYYEKGFKVGFTDGEEGNAKNYVRHLPVFLALRSPTAVESFCKGYTEGHRQGSYARRKKQQREKEQELQKSKSFAKKKQAEMNRSNLSIL